MVPSELFSRPVFVRRSAAIIDFFGFSAELIPRIAKVEMFSKLAI